MSAAALMLLLATALGIADGEGDVPADDNAAVRPIVLNDDGAWCWFQDERAIILDGRLYVGSVAAGVHDANRRGDIEVTAFDLASRRTQRFELADRFETDDHDVPAFWARPDGRLVAVFSRHGSDNYFEYRLAAGDRGADWNTSRRFSPSRSSQITYANLHFLSAENDGRGRLYNFYRGLDGRFKPSFAYSDNGGETWASGNVVVDVPATFRHRPYVKYASNGRDTIHLFYTDGHPRDADNNLYHVFYRGGMLHHSDGAAIGPLSRGLRSPAEGTCIFRGDADNVAWASDAELDAEGHPRVVFSVQKNSAGLKSGHDQAGQDHRYHYARWDGRQWQDREIAFAGRRLYAGEDDYTGNVCLHPDRPDTVFISTDADPQSGRPLTSAADNRRHWELFHGTTADGGETWTWHAITHDSAVDNLRPIVPRWSADRTALLWFRGVYRTYRNYETEVVLLLE